MVGGHQAPNFPLGLLFVEHVARHTLAESALVWPFSSVVSVLDGYLEKRDSLRLYGGLRWTN